MSRLRIAVLGTPEVRHGDRLLTFPTRKSLALLVYLAAEGGIHSRDKLATLFWPDSDDDAGRATLRSTLARLREAIEFAPDQPHLLVERHGVGVAASTIALDLDRLSAAHDLARRMASAAPPDGEGGQAPIARLADGAAAWRAEFLDGFSLRDAPGFDDWVSLQREVWRQRQVVVLDRLALLQDEAGQRDAAIETLSRWLSLDPLEERAYRRLMMVHAAAGDRSSALRAYAVCRAELEQELAMPPSPETEALADRIRSTPGRSTVARPRRARAADPAMPGDSFVGRTDEFANLVGQFHAAVRGETRVVIVHGEAGIGKTRLTAEFVAWAQARGADVLHGRAFETGSRLPFQPLVDALRARLEPGPALDALLGVTWLGELGRLLPELRDRLPRLPTPEADEASGRTRLFEAVVRLGRALAQRAPLVVYVDDAQWADVDALDLLRYAARRWAQEGVPLLLIGCLRSDALATNPFLDEWLLGLRRDLPATQIELGPLTLEDTLRLLGGERPGASDDPDIAPLARWLFAETAGQPFYLVETLRALLERGTLSARRTAHGGWAIDVVRSAAEDVPLPPSVRHLIHTRLARLTPAARDLLVAAAVLGQGASFDLLAGVSGLGESDALPALDEALQAHLLVETGEAGRGYAFAHDKIRDVAYAEAGEARRHIFHRRALAALAAHHAPPAELARHALAAGSNEAALRFSAAAGDDAMRVLAARDAAAHYERAVALAEHLGRRDLLASLHARRGHAFVSVAMWEEARRELEAAVAGLDPAERDRRCEILSDLAEACWWSLDVPSLQRHAAEVLTLSRELGRGDLETRAIAWLGAAAGSDGDTVACVEQNRRAIAHARALGLTPPAVAGSYESISLYWLGRLEEAIESGREAVAIARAAADIPFALLSLAQLGVALAGHGRYAEALAVYAETMALGREYGVEKLAARAMAMSSGLRLDVHDYAGAEAISREARELARSVGFRPPAVSAGIDLILGYARRHEVGLAEALVAEVADIASATTGFHGWLWAIRLAEARAEIALARGDWEEALWRADQAIAQARDRRRVKYEVLGRTSRARALAALGRTHGSIAELRAALALARPVGDPALFLRSAAALLTIEGDDALLAEARDAVERIDAALPDQELRRCFSAAEPLRVLARFGRITPRGG